MDKYELPLARTLLAEALKQEKWYGLTDPKMVLSVLDSCVEKTHKSVRGACWGNHVRTMACDALFREAKAGIAMNRRYQEILCVSEPVSAANAAANEKADFVQPILLLVGAVFALWGSIGGMNIIKTLIGIAGGVCIIGALLREMQRCIADKFVMGLIRFGAKLFRKEKWLQRAEKWINKSAAKQETPRSAPPRFRLDPAVLEEVCLRQMDIIDENLAFFNDPEEVGNDDEALMPLAELLLQEKYDGGISMELAEMLDQYLRARKLQVLEYDAEHAGLFHTQPMDETFTISPAILDENGKIISYGVAGVREE